jgi:hypothetical protein
MIGAQVNRPRSPSPLLAAWALLLCSGLFACNQILGIDEPKDEPLVPTMETPGSRGKDAELGEPPAQPGEEPPEETTPESGEVSAYAWAAWPMPHPPSLGEAANPQSFQQTADVVIDSVTKLVWQKMADKTLRTRDEAETYCEKLRLRGDSFRLPSRIELLSLVDFTRGTTYLDEQAFPDARAGKYWTSSRYAKSSGSAWAINFEFGTTLAAVEPATKKHFVRCVK